MKIQRFIRICYCSKLLALSVLLSTSAALGEDIDDQWSDVVSRELAATPAENRIVKWCGTHSDKVRYASANLATFPGYQPCGKIQSVANCDPSGNRYIGVTPSERRDLRDCAIGPRITVIRHESPPPTNRTRRDLATELAKSDDPIENYMGELDHLLDGDKPDQAGPVGPMSPQELKSLEQEFDKIAQDQNPFQDLQSFLLPLLSRMGNPTSQRTRPNRRNQRQLERDAGKLLKTLDPDSQKMLEQYLGKDFLKQLGGR